MKGNSARSMKAKREWAVLHKRYQRNRYNLRTFGSIMPKKVREKDCQQGVNHQRATRWDAQEMQWFPKV